MKALILSLFLAALVPAYGDTFVNMTLTGNGLYSWGGEYVSPYEATANGKTFMVACLDLTVNTSVGVAYRYDISSPVPGDLTPKVQYDAAAILMQQLLLATGDTRGELSFAVWDIFNPLAVNSDSNSQVTTNLATINAYAANALTAAANTSNVPSYTVFYPVSGSPETPEVPLGSQRYIVVGDNATVLPNPVPDGGMTVTLLGCALLGLEALRRRVRA